MASTFTWLDTSEHDRRRALEVVDLFRLSSDTYPYEVSDRKCYEAVAGQVVVG